MIHDRPSYLCLCVLLALVLLPVPASAILTLGRDLEFEGFVQAQNILRTPKFSDAELIMQRNTVQIESKYYFLRDSEAFHSIDTGPLEEGTLTVTGRGVYDSIYDIRNSYHDSFTNADKPFGKSEYKLREAFIDLLLPPFSLRLGRQQVVWGETDNFRALDVINPLDLTWHWARESWEDIRIPLWMARGIYDIGKFGPLEESFIEGIWIPADFTRNKITTDPRRPWAFTGDGLAENANAITIDGRLLELDVTVRNLKPRHKIRHGQAGFRFKAIFGEIDFSLNYFYGYSADTGVRIREDLSRIDGDVLHRVIDTVNPRSHVVGLTANYSEERFTQSVFRLETAFTTGVPVRIAEGASLEVDPDQDQFDTARRSVVMLAIDRPTWIRALNPTRTFFLSTQIFWRRYLDYNEEFRGISTVLPATIGGEVVRDRFISISEDEIDQNEFVITFAASTSYGSAGLLQPQFVFAIDPRSTGAYNRLAFDYLVSDHIVIRLQQDVYWRLARNDPGPWALGDVWGQTTGNSRHDTILSLIFQF